MKFTSNQTGSSRLELNDLGYIIKGVSQQPREIALQSGESLYITDGTEVMYSAQTGDAAKFSKAGMLTINDTVILANSASFVINHNFGFLPKVTIAKESPNPTTTTTAPTTSAPTTSTTGAPTTSTTVAPTTTAAPGSPYWMDLAFIDAATVTVETSADFNTTVVTNISGNSMTLNIRIS